MSAPGRAPAWAVDALLDDPATRTLICCGSGGVGKTTTAAALAVRAAERGRRVVVLTVDPSRRLAQALGLADGATAEPRPVPGVDTGAGGSLHAAVLDARATLDALVDDALPPERAAQLKRNPVYGSVAGSFSGTQEYMAMERLGQLREAALTGRAPWELVVVDTPPSRSALDFIDAPARLGRFLDGRLVTLLRRPTTARAGLAAVPAAVAGRVTSSISGGVAAVMDKVLGGALVRDVQALVQGLDVVFGGFQQRALATSAALAAPGSGFVVVTAAEADALAEARFLLARLARDGLPTTALVVNRATVLAPGAARLGAEEAARLAGGLAAAGHERAAGLLRLHAELALTAAAEAAAVGRLLGDRDDVAVATAAARPGDVHDVAGLREVAADLAGA